MAYYNNEITVDEITADIINADRDYLVEKAVDEFLAAERDIMSEATTTSDKMIDLYIEDTPEEIEIKDFLDESIDEDIEGEDDLFQDTMEEEGLYDNEDFIEDIDDVIDPDELLDNDYIDDLID